MKKPRKDEEARRAAGSWLQYSRAGKTAKQRLRARNRKRALEKKESVEMNAPHEKKQTVTIEQFLREASEAKANSERLADRVTELSRELEDSERRGAAAMKLLNIVADRLGFREDAWGGGDLLAAIDILKGIEEKNP